MAEERPKIIIDSDWKSQAQAEKERLAAQAAAKKPAAGTPGGAGTGGGGATPAGSSGGGQPSSTPQAEEQHDDEGMPPADFMTLVGSMVTQALLYMGGFPDPQTGRAVISLEHARFNIDLLAVLQEKTKGNLTPDEDRELSQVLNELRLRYVEITRAVAKMAAEGKISGYPGGGAAGGMGGAGMGPGGIAGPGLR